MWSGGREDGVCCGEVVRAVAAVVEQALSHSRVVDKSQEGYCGREQSQPQARPHSPGFKCQEDKAS